MKTLIVSLFALALSLTTSVQAAAQDREVPIGINGVYVPGGFDSTADAYVVVSGIFQNGCYKWSRAEVATQDTFNHEIRSVAKVSPGMCIMVLIPFQKEVRLGQLPSGKHNLKFVNGDGTYLEKTLNVE